MASKKRKTKKEITILDYVKASRKGEWEANNENETGFVSKHKVHRNKKAYTRKGKHKYKFE